MTTGWFVSMTRIVALCSSFHAVGGLVAGSRRGSNRTTSSDNWALRLTPMMPHELQKLCWQTATTIRLSTAGRSLLLLIRRAISPRLASLDGSGAGAAGIRPGASAAALPALVAARAAQQARSPG